MFEILTTIVFGILSMSLILRKVVLSTSALANNSASFVNSTSDRLHIIKSTLKWTPETGAAVAVGDMALASLDEIPQIQAQLDDSRSHIQSAVFTVPGATGGLAGVSENSHMEWNRNDLVLDVDEALFLNTLDIVGTPPVTATAVLFYED